MSFGYSVKAQGNLLSRVREFMSSRAKREMACTAVLAGCGLLMIAGCRTLSLMSQWAAEPVTADGEAGEWSLASGRTLMQDDVQVSARNDEENLNLMVRFRASDEKWARATMRSGLRLWFNPNGKKRKDLGLRIATGPRPDDLPGFESRGDSTGMLGMHLPEELRPRFESMRPKMDGSIQVIDRILETSYDLPADGSLGPAAGFTCQDGMCSYELSVPLELNGSFGLGIEPGKSVMVGITAGWSEEEREAMRERMQEMRTREPGMRLPGGMGGRRRMGGRGPGGPAGQPTDTDENLEIWIKVRLAEVG
ncbi:MAG: hypothetical protein JSU73_13670 [candidate division WOR-3 bacterium]|nr:MAG: hypothetical protein JSU73_13670 [candidate division WOR-3 bacterium]